MLRFIVHWLATAVGIGAAGYLLPGIEVDGPWAAVLGALVLGLINVTLRPIVLLLTLPLTVLSLGLFALIVNGAMLALVARWVTGVHVATFGSAVLGSIVISLVGGLLNWVLHPRE
jgi:putative membrane protein